MVRLCNGNDKSTDGQTSDLFTQLFDRLQFCPRHNRVLDTVLHITKIKPRE